jgi:hypothetical protein
MQEEHRNDVSSADEGTAVPVPVAASTADEPVVIDRPRGARAALTAGQEIALQRLFAGSSVAQAARAAQVDRRTVFRWMQENHHFVAAYNAWQREMVASGRARVLAMNDLALDTVQNAMLKGDTRAAIQVAKANGAMDAPKPGTTDPDYFHHRKKLRDRARRKAIEAAERKELTVQRNQPERSPSHCEYMINTYIKCLREALLAESPEDRARRLKQQPEYRRNFDPMTLRLFRTGDADAAGSAEAPTVANPTSVLDAPAVDTCGGTPSAPPTAPASDASPG